MGGTSQSVNEMGVETDLGKVKFGYNPSTDSDGCRREIAYLT